MQAVAYSRHKGGGRIHVFGLRIHHGAVGAALLMVGAVGAALVIHDWADRWWTRDGD